MTDLLKKGRDPSYAPGPSMSARLPKLAKKASFKCVMCKRVFGTQASYLSHAKTCGNKQPYLYTCDFCHKKYKTLSYLNAHIVRDHSDE
jgi:hypothetical protein